MKSLFIIFLIILFSCDKAKKMKAELSGNHSLRKFMPTQSQSGRLSGSFFWFMGGLNGENETVTYASFSWKMNSGAYAVSKIPITDIRVHPDSSIREPYITFSIADKEGYVYRDDQVQYFLEKYLTYATVHCREEDFKPEINISIYPQKSNQ